MASLLTQDTLLPDALVQHFNGVNVLWCRTPLAQERILSRFTPTEFWGNGILFDISMKPAILEALEGLVVVEA